MDKETLIQELKAKIGENDFAVLSAQSVDGIVTPLLPMFADDTKVTEASYELPVSLLKNFIGQYRHDVAAGITSSIESEKARLAGEHQKAIEDFKAQWEKDHPTVTPPVQPVTPPDSTPDIDKKVNELLTARINELLGEKGALGELKSDIGTMSNYIKGLQAQQERDAIASIGKQLENHIIERSGGPLTTEEQNALEVAMMGFEIKADSKVDDLKKTFETRYEAIYKKLYPNGGMPFGNAGGEGGEKSGFEAFMEKRKEEAKRNAEEMDAVKKSFV